MDKKYIKKNTIPYIALKYRPKTLFGLFAYHIPGIPNPSEKIRVTGWD